MNLSGFRCHGLSVVSRLYTKNNLSNKHWIFFPQAPKT
jgi:hypothetical protein